MRLLITIIIIMTIPVLAYCSGIHDHVYHSFQIVDAIKDSFKNEFGIDVVNNQGLSTEATRYFVIGSIYPDVYREMHDKGADKATEFLITKFTEITSRTDLLLNEYIENFTHCIQLMLLGEMEVLYNRLTDMFLYYSSSFQTPSPVNKGIA